MKSILEKYIKHIKANYPDNQREMELRQHKQVDAIFEFIFSLYGKDKLSLKAAKVNVQDMMNSNDIREKTFALQRIVLNDDSCLKTLPDINEVDQVIERVEEKLADAMARREVEYSIEKRINEVMQKKHKDYINEIKKQIIKDETGPENPSTLKKYAMLEKLETRGVTRSAFEVLRPSSLDQIIGQKEAVTALISKIASPFPQHVILYGPPGVGKTTAARLVLEEAKRLPYTPFNEDSKFVEIDGSTLRWDPREVTDPLLGSVHDPIYQGARRDLADGGIPEPKPGLVTEAHGGILFIDEIGELDPMLQNKLLKVLEDRRVKFDSSYYDPTNNNIPKYIKKLFEEGAPADFILIGATTRHPSEISPALRSRCAEVFFKPLKPEAIIQIVGQSASKLNADLEKDVPTTISHYTIEGRKAVNLLADAYGFALYQGIKDGKKDRQCVTVTLKNLYDVIKVSRMVPMVHHTVSDEPEIGKVYGLGVRDYLGSLIEFEAIAVQAAQKGKGNVRFNDAAGIMAKDSVFNALTVARQYLGNVVFDYDIHINATGGGNIDGPSAGVAIFASIMSAVLKKPLAQNIAMTGEVSIQGRIKPVGGIYEKVFGAKQAGIKTIILPETNLSEAGDDLEGMKIIPVSHVREIVDWLFPETFMMTG
jgi:ATP-dependent Lon protease